MMSDANGPSFASKSSLISLAYYFNSDLVMQAPNHFLDDDKSIVVWWCRHQIILFPDDEKCMVSVKKSVLSNHSYSQLIFLICEKWRDLRGKIIQATWLLQNIIWIILSLIEHNVTFLLEVKWINKVYNHINSAGQSGQARRLKQNAVRRCRNNWVLLFCWPFLISSLPSYF